LLESMLIESEVPPTEIVSVPVPMVEVEAETGLEVSVAAVARFCTESVYWPATAPVDAVAEATVGSPTVASKPASWVGFSSAERVPWSVSSALVKVPNAETCESSAVSCLVISFCGPAPKALVNEDTMAAISSPDPMPVEVTSAPPAEDDEVDEGVVAPDMVELIWNLSRCWSEDLSAHSAKT
jgi:hypothetical protein